MKENYMKENSMGCHSGSNPQAIKQQIVSIRIVLHTLHVRGTLPDAANVHHGGAVGRR